MMRVRKWSHVATLADQGINSATNLVLVILSSQALDPTGFGRFAVSQAVMLLVELTAGAATVDVVLRATDRELESVVWSGARLATRVAVASGLTATAVFMAFSSSLPSLILGSIALAGPVAGLDYCRAIRIRRGHLTSAIIWDCGYGVLQISTIAIATSVFHIHSLSLILLLWASSSTVSLAGAAWGIASHSVHERTSWIRPRYSVELFLVSGTSLLAQLAVTPLLGLAFAGAVRGAQIVFGPINFLLSGTRALLLPTMSRTNYRRARAIAVSASIALAAVTALTYTAWLVLPSSERTGILGASAPAVTQVMPYVAALTVAQCFLTFSFYLARAKHYDRATLLSRLYQVAGTVVAVALALLTRSWAIFLVSQTGALLFGAVVQAAAIAADRGSSHIDQPTQYSARHAANARG